MSWFLAMLEHITVADIFFWSAAIFVVVLFLLSVISALTRSTKNNVLHGLPRE